MKLSELHRKYADALDLCEKHGISPTCAIKLDGKFLVYQSNLPSPEDCYTFPVAVVEGKPVFVGDRLYAHNELLPVIASGNDVLLFDKGNDYVLTVSNNDVSWNPPKPQTFMLNGVEFTVPSKVRKTSDEYAFEFTGNWYLFKNVDEALKFRDLIERLLDGKLNPH